MHTYQTESGTWRTVVQHGGRRRSVTAKTRKQSVERAARLLVELGGQPLVEGGTVGELLDEHLERQPIARSTREAYERVRRNHLPADFEARRAATIAPPAIDALYRRLEAAGVDANPLIKLNALLSGAFKRAVRMGWITVNPCRDAHLPAAGEPDVRAPEPDEARALLAACDAKSPQFGTFARVAANSGGRPGELVALRRSDVDVDERSIYFQRAIQRVRGGLVEADLKTGAKGRRKVSIGAGTMAHLAAYLLGQDLEAMDLGLSPLGPDARIFSEDFSTPWYPGTPSSWWREARHAVGITDVRLYDLRHYVATELFAGGFDDQTAMRRLGHSNPTMSSKRYGHSRPARDRAAGEYLEGTLGD